MKPFRLEKVGSEIQHLVSDVISNKLHDPRIATLTSVTRVEISRDLEAAKIYISVFGDEKVQRRTLDALDHARGFIQTHVARGLDIRQCPRISFWPDTTIKKQIEVSRLIEESMNEIEENERRRTSDGEGGAE